MQGSNIPGVQAGVANINPQFKGVAHFTKSECPTPKKWMFEDGRKGHTQARFFSRKNSNSG